MTCSSLLLTFAACGNPEEMPDAAMSPDALAFDAITSVDPDASLIDAGVQVDAPVADAGPLLPDAAPPDAAPPDATLPDAALPDAALPDAALPDAALPDAALPDAALPDAAPPDAPGPISCIDTLHGSHYLRTNGTVVHWNSTPTVITVAGGAELTGVTEIYSGGHHGCARVDDGTVWCWATASFGNRNGQLGNGSIVTNVAVADFYIATQVLVNSGGVSTALATVAHLSGGSSRGYAASNTCGVLVDETVWCWGAPDSSGGGGGTLFNDGIAGNRAYAVPILSAMNGSPMTGVQAVSLGLRHACVIRNGATNAEVWCWGANIGGPLGQGDQVGRPYPVKVPLAGPVDQLGAGGDATCARVGDAVYCWGSNNSGQVGIGDHTSAANHDGCINYCKLTPKQVVDGTGTAVTGVVDFNMAYLSACALLDDDSVSCWGRIASASQTDWAIPAVVGGTTLDNVALHTTLGTGGYAQSMLYLTGDNRLIRVNSELTQLCP